MSKWKFIVFSILVGLFVGFANGFMGAGGGMLLVPLLTLLFKMDTKITHTTAVFVILPICLISGITYIIKGVVAYQILLPVAIGTCVGGVVGTFALKKLSAEWLSYIFYGVMIFSGVWMLVK